MLSVFNGFVRNNRKIENKKVLNITQYQKCLIMLKVIVKLVLVNNSVKSLKNIFWVITFTPSII